MEQATRRQETSLGLWPALQTKSLLPLQKRARDLLHSAIWHMAPLPGEQQGASHYKRKTVPLSVTEEALPNLGSPEQLMLHQDRRPFLQARAGCDPQAWSAGACRQVLQPRSHEVGVPLAMWGISRVQMGTTSAMGTTTAVWQARGQGACKNNTAAVEGKVEPLQSQAGSPNAQGLRESDLSP